MTMMPSARKAKAKERAQIERDVAAFLSNGGEIQQVTSEDNACYKRDMARLAKSKDNKRREWNHQNPRKSGRGMHPMTVSPGKVELGQRMQGTPAQREAKRMHHWRTGQPAL